MALQSLNRGLTPNTPVSDDLWTATEKINENFTYLDGRIDEVVATIDQDNIDIRKNFRILDGDTPTQMLARINALANYTVTEKQSVWFVGNQMAEPVEIGEIPPLPRTVKFKMMNKGKGTYGTGGTALTLNDLELVYDNGATAGDIETAPSTDIVTFGDIGSGTVENWLNTHTPTIVIQSQEDGYTLFKGTIDGDAVSYLWLGAAGTYGVSALQATAADFQLLEETVPAVDQNNIGRRIFIGFLDEDSPIGQVVSKLNAITFTIGERESPVLITAFRTVDGIATQKMAFQWMSGKGVFGAGGTGVLLTDIFAHTPEIILPTDVQDDDYTVLIPLNEIAEGGFLAAANAEERDLSDAGLEYFFTYIFDDVTYLVQFIGANHVYGGGGTPLVAEDFTQISDTNTPPVVVPNLQQVMEAGDPDTTLPMTFIDAANHSKIRVTGQGLDYQQDDINTHVVFESPVNDVALTIPAKAADDTFAMLSDVEAAIAGGINAIEYPSDMSFRPFPIYQTKGKYFTTLKNRDLVKEKIDTMLPYYVGFTGASNSNNGLTKSTSFATINYAYSLGARLIYVAEGIYSEGNFGTIINTTASDLIIIGAGMDKTVLTTSPSSFVWTLVSGAMYSTPLTLATRVVDNKYVDAFGFSQELTKVNSQAVCASTAGTKFVDTATNIVYAHLSDGRVPDSKVLVLRHTINAQYKGGTNYIYCEGINFMGGSDAFKSLRNAPTTPTDKHVLMYRCAFLYAGGQEYNTGEGQGYACSEVPFNWLQECVAYRNERDGFNYKGSAPLPKFVEIDCQSFLNGETSSESRINGSSGHGGCPGLRLNGEYFSNWGPNVIDVDASLSTPGKGPSLCLGVVAYDSRGYGTDPQYPPIADFAFVGGVVKKAYIVGCTSLSTIAYAAISDSFTGNIVVDSNSINKGTYTVNVSFGAYTPGGGDKYIYPALSTPYTAAPAPATVQNSLAASTTVAPSATAVNNGLALKLDATSIEEFPETTYGQSETFSGTVPTGTAVKNWRGTRIGKKVSFRVNITYATPGAGITTLMIPFPTGLPTPSNVTGYSTNNDYPISCIGFMNTGTSAQPPAARAYVRKTSSGHVIYIIAASGAYSGAIATVDYWTD